MTLVTRRHFFFQCLSTQPRRDATEPRLDLTRCSSSRSLREPFLSLCLHGIHNLGTRRLGAQHALHNFPHFGRYREGSPFTTAKEGGAVRGVDRSPRNHRPTSLRFIAVSNVRDGASMSESRRVPTGSTGRLRCCAAGSDRESLCRRCRTLCGDMIPSSESARDR